MADEYISFEQIPFGSEDFVDNPEPRCPCVLLLDTSGSMSGRPIQQLNEGIQLFKDELISDPLATKRVEVAVVTFGPVSIESDFQTVNNFYPRTLNTTGDTPMGSAITLGVDILITDGAPTDSWTSAARLVKEGEEKKSFAFFAIGVEGANMDTLKQISVREPMKLRGLMFREFFMWLSSSMKMVSSKTPGSAVSLLPHTGWSEL